MKLEALFAHYLELQPPSPSLASVLRLSWPKFVRFCQAQGIVFASEVTPTVLEDFYKGLLWEPNERGQFYKPNSVDQFLRRVRQVLRWSVAQGLLESDPTAGLLLPRPLQPVPDLLTWKQLKKLLKAPDRKTPLGLRDALLLQLLAESDLPLTQLLALSEETLRELELQATTWTLVAEYLEHGRPALAQSDHSALFLGRGGEPLGQQAASVRINEMARQTGLGKRLPSRLLRKSYRAALQQVGERHPLSQKRCP